MKQSRTFVNILFSVAAVTSYYALAAHTSAQVPVIDIQSDLDVVGINEALDVTGTNTWSTKASALTHRFDFAIAAVPPAMMASPLIYVVGGKVFRDTPPIATLEAYDPATNSWTGLADMPTPRALAGAAALSGSMFVVGGAGPSGALTTVGAYHPPMNTGTAETPMNTARSGPAVAVASNGTQTLLFAIGGENSGGVLNSVEAFSPVTHLWKPKAAMPTARKNAVVGVVDGIIYVIGGDDGVTSFGVDVVEAYDPVANSWSTKTPIPKKQPNAAGAVANGLIYVVGGVDSNAVVNTASTLVQVYDPVSNTWSIGPNTPSARSNLRAAVIDGVLYAIGGRYFSVARVGRVFAYQILASGNPSTFDATSLPSGLMVDTSLGLVFGKPVTPSDTTVTTLKAINGQGTGTANTRLTVVDSNTAASPLAPMDSASPAIVSATSVTGRAGVAFIFQVLVEGASDAAILTAGDLPAGVTSNSETGVITGDTTTVEGTSSVELTLQDGSLPAVTQELQLTFTANLKVPVITSPESATLVPGQFFTYKVTTDGSLGGTFSFIGTDGVELGALPPDLTWNGIDTISGTYNPGSVGAHAGGQALSARLSQKQIDTIKIRPPNAVIELDGNAVDTATGASLTAVKPLDLFEVTAVSRLTQTVGTVTTNYDIPLPLQNSPDASGVECRDGKGNFQVVVTFPTAIQNFNKRRVTVEGTLNNPMFQSTISADKKEVTIKLKGALDQQRLTITLSDMTVDGGANTYDVVVPMGLLIGDQDGDGVVDPDDWPTSDLFRQTDADNYRWDFNWSGTVDNTDLQLAKRFTRQGHHLPPM